ncbi:probable glutamate receptor [Eriocheir sinensis]|uniref:probable glutamate receptor n=1 Tax=Eriocheir sinensis TaxID=95602 RepID=UPI0021CACA7B|nr:probable glutamate receptor [Eriocheir sinensis]
MEMCLYLAALWIAVPTIALGSGNDPFGKSRNATLIDAEALQAVHQSSADKHVLLVIQDAAYSKRHVLRHLRAPSGLALFEVTGARDTGANSTQEQVIDAIEKAELVAETSMKVLVLVLSDEAAILAAFAHWSLRSRLLAWERRLLVLTRYPPHRVPLLHRALALTNSLLLTPSTNDHSVLVSVVLPYSRADSVPEVLAVWTPQEGLVVEPHAHLFPHKFEKLSMSYQLLVAMTEDAMHKKVYRADPSTREKQFVTFDGYMVRLMDYVAQGLNFSYRFVPSPDNSYGTKNKDGSWTGMVGQVKREEVDIGLGPFTLTTDRARVVDFTWPVEVTSGRILAGQHSLEVDPWGFMLPLSPEVWAATFAFIIFLPALMFLLSWSVTRKGKREKWVRKQFEFLSMILQESIAITANSWWWWERVIVVFWLLATLVLRRSYEGNLISHLAVRHIPQPYQSLRDVLDDRSAVMIWKKGSSFVELIETSDSGIFREVLNSAKDGRLRFLSVNEYLQVMDRDVINGNQVIIDFAFNLIPISGKTFSLTGRCNVYIGRERLISQSLGMIGQKGHPLVPAITRKLLSMIEAGLYSFWYRQVIPNSTSCDKMSSKVTVHTPLSLSNSWAMFAMLLGGSAVSLVALLLEVLVFRIDTSFTTKSKIAGDHSQG